MSWGTEFTGNVLIRNAAINSVKDAERLIERAVKPIHRFQRGLDVSDKNIW